MQLLTPQRGAGGMADRNGRRRGATLKNFFLKFPKTTTLIKSTTYTKYPVNNESANEPR